MKRLEDIEDFIFRESEKVALHLYADVGTKEYHGGNRRHREIAGVDRPEYYKLDRVAGNTRLENIVQRFWRRVVHSRGFRHHEILTKGKLSRKIEGGNTKSKIHQCKVPLMK